MLDFEPLFKDYFANLALASAVYNNDFDATAYVLKRVESFDSGSKTVISKLITKQGQCNACKGAKSVHAGQGWENCKACHGYGMNFQLCSKDVAKKVIEETADQLVRKVADLKSKINSCEKKQPTEFQSHKFNFGEGADFEHETETEFRSEILFDRMWKNGYHSAMYKDFVRPLFYPIPDGLSFSVYDIEKETYHYTVTFNLLTYGQVDYNDDDRKKWMENPAQDESSCSMARRFSGIKNYERLTLRIPLTDATVEDWHKGQILVSDGWIGEVLIENSVSRYKDGSTSKNKKLHFSSEFGKVFYRSYKERQAIESTVAKALSGK